MNEFAIEIYMGIVRNALINSGHGQLSYNRTYIITYHKYLNTNTQYVKVEFLNFK